MSKSGIDTRSGFRNRSNSKPNSSGSRSVIVRAQATTEPAPEPRPGPTGIPASLAHLMKSETIRKYPGKPIPAMTSSSYRSLSR